MIWLSKTSCGHFLRVVVFAGLALFFSSCQDSSSVPADEAAKVSSAPIVIVLIPKITGNAFFEAANDGAQAYAAKNGFKVDYRGSETARVEDQIAIVEEAVREGVKGLTISALDAESLDEVLKKAMDGGMVVTTWDSDVASDARKLMTSQGTPAQLGRMLVEMASKSLRQRGKDPTTDPIKYVWHYSQATVSDQNSWNRAGEEYIRQAYPNWENLNPQNYYSEQNPEKAKEIGRTILETHPDIDAIICNDSTSLPGQAQAAKEMGLTAQDVAITGFASPNAMKQYAREGVIDRWGLWDCQIQAALSCYLTWHLVNGNSLGPGSVLNVPDIGVVEVMPNTVLDPQAKNAPNSGVVLLPTRTEFTVENMDQYDF
ncbi:MAG: substrate-binding domain-containing protein [Deltaproteobacteria bacterium]|jgi:AI-2 transport system substrate-binding protein|nr:substrate-binding domain-containing protein [Deltaproteobacteria bacterium]